MADAAALHRFLQHELEAEAAEGFPRLRRVPSVRVRQFLDYFASLTPSGQAELVEAASLFGATGLAHQLGLTSGLPDVQQAAAWKGWTNIAVQTGYRYWSIPQLRTAAAQVKVDRRLGRASIGIPKEVAELAESVRGIKAPALRAAVKAALGELLGVRPRNEGAGEWTYAGSLHGTDVVVSVDYGGRHAQLSYQVAATLVGSELRVLGGLERCVGVGFGDWDYIVEENLANSMDLLCQLVDWEIGLPRRLPPGCLPG